MPTAGIGRLLRNGPGAVVRGRLFLSSYAPLFAILAARTCPGLGDADKPLWTFIVTVALAAWGVADAAWLLAGSGQRNAVSVTPLQVDEQGAAVAGYLPTYLVPFIGVGPQSTGGWIGYGIYLVVLFVVFLGSDFALVNPTLYLLGRRVTRVRIEQRSAGVAPRTVSILVVSRAVPRVAEPMRLTRLAGCWVQKEDTADA